MCGPPDAAAGACLTRAHTLSRLWKQSYEGRENDAHSSIACPSRVILFSQLRRVMLSCLQK